MIPKLKPFIFKTFYDWMLTFGCFSIRTLFQYAESLYLESMIFLFPCILCVPVLFLSSIRMLFIIIKKKKKNSIIAKVTYESCQESPTS